jgi:predicted membrane channel-forming protein YqfA (hemolysin III family)
MRRLVHTMIFLLIAGTNTGRPAGQDWAQMPGCRRLLGFGWIAVLAMPRLFVRLGVAGGLLIVTGRLVTRPGRPCMPRSS